MHERARGLSVGDVFLIEPLCFELTTADRSLDTGSAQFGESAPVDVRIWVDH